jgi:hypothetical protein
VVRSDPIIGLREVNVTAKDRKGGHTKPENIRSECRSIWEVVNAQKKG